MYQGIMLTVKMLVQLLLYNSVKYKVKTLTNVLRQVSVLVTHPVHVICERVHRDVGWTYTREWMIRIDPLHLFFFSFTNNRIHKRSAKYCFRIQYFHRRKKRISHANSNKLASAVDYKIFVLTRKIGNNMRDVLSVFCQ